MVVAKDPATCNQEERTMKRIVALVIAAVLATVGSALAGRAGQGAKPDAKKPEYKEAEPRRYYRAEGNP
jgi:hypothetical protein